MSRSDDDDATLLTSKAKLPFLDDNQTLEGQERLQLLIGLEGAYSLVDLPARGTVTLGRGAECTVRLAHSSVSRVHATLSLGERCSIVDMGSSNGTRVAGHEIPQRIAVDIQAGDAIEIGAVSAMLRRAESASPPRGLLPHEYFKMRVEEECARRKRKGGTFTVLGIRAPVDTPTDAVIAALSNVLRAHDVLALHGPGGFEVLLDAAPEVTAGIIERVRIALLSRGVIAELFFGYYPKDGTTADELIGRARPSNVRTKAAPVALAGQASHAMEELRGLVARIAPSNLSVLIIGETGVGKEVMAQTVHRLSPRAQKTFLAISCAALPEPLLESELFGHERGAFTGASSAKKGLLETADGGTVFLDEIGELPQSTQVKLLRVLEERRITRLGGLVAKSLDVRFVAATNRDLEAEIQKGSFRSDLYYRLSGVVLHIPPLRERKTEIETLVKGFASHGRDTVFQISDDALSLLLAYPWPGNIRELRNVMERAAVLAGDRLIDLIHLPADKMLETMARGAKPMVDHEIRSIPPTWGVQNVTGDWPVLSETPLPTTLRGDIDAVERQRILSALETAGGNQTKAARSLGISRNTLIARLDRYGIVRPRKM